MLFVHYLDVARHFVAYASQPFNWITNVTASVVIFALVSLFWPRARKAYKAFFLTHMTDLHQKLDDQHEERLRQSESLHVRSMDLAKKHHAELLTHVAKTVPRAPAITPVKPTSTRRK